MPGIGTNCDAALAAEMTVEATSRPLVARKRVTALTLLPSVFLGALRIMSTNSTTDDDSVAMLETVAVSKSISLLMVLAKSSGLERSIDSRRCVSFLSISTSLERNGVQQQQQQQCARPYLVGIACSHNGAADWHSSWRSGSLLVILDGRGRGRGALGRSRWWVIVELAAAGEAVVPLAQLALAAAGGHTWSSDGSRRLGDDAVNTRVLVDGRRAVRRAAVGADGHGCPWVYFLVSW
ncbi:hypothetical protein BC831DRAFT_468663 [Entophlyctis helioformis]|nr:hypothetical protein BC831DRAFT_468663 [Entophlyctis helioformis]